MVQPISLTCAVRIDPTTFASESLSARDMPGQAPIPDPQADRAEPPPHRESLRVLVIGSRNGVTNTIQTLYRLGFAEVAEWSPLLPAPNQGEVMSILTRYILIPPK